VSAAAFDAAHDLTKSSVSHLVDRTIKTYWFVVTGESGADSQTGGFYYVPRVTFTRAKLGEE
jgi:hypothetical protein